jgi:hypothetical protein
MAARNPGKEYTEFQEQDLITSNNGQQTNAFDIYCPVDACRCKLLLAKAATLVQREKSKVLLSYSSYTSPPTPFSTQEGDAPPLYKIILVPMQHPFAPEL